MSLYVPADGILKTHLTWDELQKSVINAFGEEAIFGPNKDVKDIGVGNGIMSRICLILPEWQTELKDVPKKFIVKIASQLSIVENKAIMDHSDVFNEELLKHFENQVKRNHNAEVRFYELMKKYSVESIPIPKVYITQEFTEENPLNGYMIMEYIEDGTVSHLHSNVAPEHMTQVMKALAKLQASTVKFTDEEKGYFNSHPYVALFEEVFNNEKNPFIGMLRQFAGEQLKDQIDQLEGIFPEFMDVKILEELPKSLGLEPVLCHGDLWATNLLWRNTKDHRELAAVIDFQNVHFGFAAVDFVRVFCGCMSAKDRKESWETLLEKFYKYLEEELVGHSMPYTLDMLKASYRRFFPLGAFLMLPLFGPSFMIVNNSSDVEFKGMASMVMFEKAAGLLEDICKFHQDNKQKN